MQCDVSLAPVSSFHRIETGRNRDRDKCLGAFVAVRYCVYDQGTLTGGLGSDD
jgi:hypothetical protein